MDEAVFADLLSRVEKPARYVGNELNAVHKEHIPGRTRVLLAFPDLYEVGMSHLGLKILYYILNNRDDVVAERAFAPGLDMETRMKEKGVPLFGLESRTPASEFDIVGFSLQYELSYTNVLNMLALSGIPLLQRERSDSDPLVIGGGPCAFNPEPLADFFDLFAIGDGEEVIGDIVDTFASAKAEGLARSELLVCMAGIPGVYVPSLYEVEYHGDGRISRVYPRMSGVPERVTRRVVKDLGEAPYPDKFVVPFMEIVHDRIMLEIFRGCTRGCRFCQAGMVYRPVRERCPEEIEELARRLVESTGYEELSLLSLSSADYSCIGEVLHGLIEKFAGKGISVSLPSLRVDSFSIELAKEVEKARKTGLTFAPEAGTQRLRDIINKGVTEENLMEAAGAAFGAGWRSIKLYFMIGLPFETDGDVEGIGALAAKVRDLGRKVLRESGVKGSPKIGVSVSSFVPKPHTPFQWFGQDARTELERKQGITKRLVSGRGLDLSWHDVDMSFLEAVFARGDRRLGRAILYAWEMGARFDGWHEHFKFGLWMDAFCKAELDPAFYANRRIGFDETLPWDHIDAGVRKSFLLREARKAAEGVTTSDCRFGGCEGCGICMDMDVALSLANGLRGNKAFEKD